MIFKNYKNKKKLIIYHAAPYFNTWPRKWKLHELENYGFDVELWSTEEIFWKIENIKAASSGSSSYLYKELKIFKIKDLISLEKKVSELDNKAILCIMSLGTLDNNHYNNPELDIFNKHKIKYVIHHTSPYQAVLSAWFKLKFNIKLLEKRIRNKKKKPSLIIGSGSEGRKQVFKIYSNSFKYQSMPSPNVSWFKEKPIIKDKIIVYIEEALNLSPDATLFGQNRPVNDLESFYNRLNDVFEKIENWTNLKVVVAASGKYHYNLNPFKNRTIIYEKTLNLIQHAEFVIGHRSLALEQAIVNYKPLLFLKDKTFSKTSIKSVDIYSKVYGRKPIWTNQLTKKIFLKNAYVNKKFYNEIINKYLKEVNTEGAFVDNFVSALQKL